MRVIRYESKLSKTGWLYEASIFTPDAGRFPTAASSRTRRRASRSGPNVSERVVFNGYFLKIMKYQAGDVARGAPVLVGKLGWDPGADGGPEGSPAPAPRQTRSSGRSSSWAPCS